MTPARNNGVRIEAHSVDLLKMKDSSELSKMDLKIEQETKLNPRLIMHGVPCGLYVREVEDQIVALNVKKEDRSKEKIIYMFPIKNNRATTSCIVEVTPEIRNMLLKERHIYINYSVCSLSDHVRVLQCFKCLAFGHFAKNCKSAALCGHCAGNHELKDCTKRMETATCGNCKK